MLNQAWDEVMPPPVGSEVLKTEFGNWCRSLNYIIETFPIVKRKDIQKYGDYRTKDTILKIYDEMKKAMETGKPYQTILDPPPGPPMDAAGNFIPIAQWDNANWPTHIHRPRDWKKDVDQ